MPVKIKVMNRKKIEIAVPVYNEEKQLKTKIEELYNYCLCHLDDYDWHITIADNASYDNTPVIAASLTKKNPKISVFRLEQKGRGRAVKQVWSRSTADYCVYTDLDMSTDLRHLSQLLQNLDDGADIAVGSRLAQGSKVINRTFLREFISRTLNFFFIRLLFNTHFTDAQCGFKAVNKRAVDELIPRILDNDWFFDGELLIVGEKSGYRISEVPVQWRDDPGSTVKLLPTIWGDIKVMIRLLMTRPWKMK